MPTEVQTFICPRCRKGEFRALPGPNGQAHCPWCGDAVAPGSPAPAPAPSPEFSLEELANRIAGHISGPPAAPASPDLVARLAESERRREAAETELRRELDKKQEIKKVVVAEVGRLEAELVEARNRTRGKDDEHAGALQSLNLLLQAKQDEWNGDRLRHQDALDQKDKTIQALEGRLEERQKSAADLQSMMNASRADVGKLHAEVAAKEAARAEVNRKLDGLRKSLQEAQAKEAGLQTELQKKDQRIKELQLLIKTLGERLNALADRAPGRGA